MLSTQKIFLIQSVPHPTAPPGFRIADPEFACNIRSVLIPLTLGREGHIGLDLDQYVPALSIAGVARFTVKVVPITTTGWFVALNFVRREGRHCRHN